MIHSAKNHLKKWLSKTLWAYDAEAFTRQLRKMGVQPGSTLMVHASWQQYNGFSGKPADLIDAMQHAVGEDGLLVMTSMPYHNMSSAEWLAQGKPMDIRRTPSMMGLVSEVFRRSKGVHRSLSVTHPLLAWGNGAEQFLSSHPNSDRPFGPESPFAQLAELDAIILGYDVPFSTFTYTHFAEDHLADTLPVPLYEKSPVCGRLIDFDGNEHKQCVQVLSVTANRMRREHRLVSALERNGSLQRTRIGNTRLIWIAARSLLAGAVQLAQTGPHFFDSPSVAG